MKRNQSIFFILILSAFVFCFNSCCKKPECKCKEQWGKRVKDCTPIHYGPYYLGEVKDFLYFKKGTWWVYENDLSHETDSVYVVAIDTTFKEKTGLDQPWKTLSYSDLYVRLRSDKFKYTTEFTEPAYYPDVTDFSFGHLYFKVTDFDAETSHQSNCFFTPFNSKKGYDCPFINTIPSLIVKGKTYYDVVIFELGSDETVVRPNLNYVFGSGGKARYYWAKGFGIIVHETLLFRQDTQKSIWQKWELKKFNIIK